MRLSDWRGRPSSRLAEFRFNVRRSIQRTTNIDCCAAAWIDGQSGHRRGRSFGPGCGDRDPAGRWKGVGWSSATSPKRLRTLDGGANCDSRRHRDSGGVRPGRLESVGELVAAAATAFGGVDAMFNVGADMRALVCSDTDVVDIDLDIGGSGDGGESSRIRRRDEACDSADARAWRRGDRQHVVGGRLSARTRPPGLCHRQGGHRGADTPRRISVGEGRHPVQRRGTRLHRDRGDSVGSAMVVSWKPPHLRRIRGTRVGVPDDVASLVAFLLSDEGEWINGQVINLDGGTVLR